MKQWAAIQIWSHGHYKRWVFSFIFLCQNAVWFSSLCTFWLEGLGISVNFCSQWIQPFCYNQFQSAWMINSKYSGSNKERRFETLHRSSMQPSRYCRYSFRWQEKGWGSDYVVTRQEGITDAIYTWVLRQLMSLLVINRLLLMLAIKHEDSYHSLRPRIGYTQRSDEGCWHPSLNVPTTFHVWMRLYIHIPTIKQTNKQHTQYAQPRIN